jgi:hypothetical protein
MANRAGMFQLSLPGHAERMSLPQGVVKTKNPFLFSDAREFLLVETLRARSWLTREEFGWLYRE